MNSLTRMFVWVLLTLTAACLLGCKDKTKEISTPAHLLKGLHKTWQDARDSLQSGAPNYEFFRVLNNDFSDGRLRRKLEEQYEGPDQAEIIEKLDSLAEKYRQKVTRLLHLNARPLTLLPGKTDEDLRQAFDSLQQEYEQFKTLTTPKE